MAYKEEKAQSMLNKWWAMQRALYVRDPDAPPPLVSDCNSMKESYRWRETIMKEIGDKVAEIQNAGLGDYRIRAINDEINKLLNHKRMWENRIRELGGPDFKKLEAKFYDRDGIELPGSGGYKYFGAAKDLPGVRELFFKEISSAPEKNIKELYKNLDFEYFDLDLEEFEDDIKEEEIRIKNQNVENFIINNEKIILEKYENFFGLEEDEIDFILENDIFGEIKVNYPLKYRDDVFEEKKALEQKKKELISKLFSE